MHLIARIVLRGIYFPQVTRFQWLRAFGQNWRLGWELATQVWAARGSLARSGEARNAPLPRVLG